MGPREAQSGQQERQSAPRARATVALPPAEPDSAPAPSGADRSSPATRMPIDFAAEYEKAYRVLWVVAAGVLGRTAGAEDVVQEAALLALKKVDQFEPGTHFAAWMAQMVRFVALNHLRKQSRSHAASLDENDPSTNRLAPRGANRDGELHLGTRGEVPPGQRSFDDELMHALGSLSEIARACLLLRTVEEMSYEEIGQVLGIPDGTAMSHVHRSRMRLREQLLTRRPGGPSGGGGGNKGEGRQP